jgi:hypothetical protein
MVDDIPDTAWVEKFVGEHEAWRQVPPCWHQHPSVVTELSVLAAWDAALTAGTVTKDGEIIPTPPATWAAYLDYVGRALNRIAAGPAAKCAAGYAHEAPMAWDLDDFVQKEPP